MKKAKFVQDAKLDPCRYYRNPSDLIRDRRLTHEDRLDILAAWEREALGRPNDAHFNSGESEELLQLRRVREELERAAEPIGRELKGLRRAEEQF